MITATETGIRITNETAIQAVGDLDFSSFVDSASDVSADLTLTGYANDTAAFTPHYIYTWRNVSGTGDIDGTGAITNTEVGTLQIGVIVSADGDSSLIITGTGIHI